MALILRVYRPDIPVLIRSYGTQRRQHNYYDVLRISPGSSQKEIRRAFLKLSKEMHPDVCGEKGHAEFVKLNEAYSVLSKQDKRRQYDTNLRYNDMSSHNAHSHSYENVYTSRRHWEERMAGYPGGPYAQSQINVRSALMFCMFLIFMGTFVQTVMNYAMRQKRIQRMMMSAELEREYNNIKEDAKRRTTQEQIDRLSKLYKAYNSDDYK